MIIKTSNLTKRYDTQAAVNNLNLEIRAGEIFGLLGPNGAGKTTTILMLLGLTEPSEGSATIAGYNPTTEPLEVKRIVGYLPDSVGFYEDLTGRENLRYTARLNNLPPAKGEQRIDYLLQRVGLTKVQDQPVGTYSRGMRQRLGIADALVKDPTIVILDEPTLGIDPEGTREVLAVIRQLAQQDGRTVLLSSHLLHQMQEICDRVGIFVRGKLLACGAIDTLGDQVLAHEPQQIEIRAQPVDRRQVELIAAIAGVETVERDQDGLIVTASRDVRAELSKTLIEANYSLVHLRQRGRELDDIYRRYFARQEVS
ncbi:MAG: ABC transporter ATP-binding protein [Firmicutes bacterium]|nr:ABC transporter ATP-binding protein [Bacillota bacterium]